MGGDEVVHLHFHFGGRGDEQKERTEIGEIHLLVTDLQRRAIIMTDAVGALNTSLDNIQGDITGLKDAVAAAATAGAALQAALDAALADQAPVVAAAVAAAVADEKAANDAALADLVAKADAIDAETPPVETPPAA